MCLRPSWAVLEEIEMGVTDDVEDSLRRWVLQKIRQGVTVERISLALAAQKVELMQADQYLTAIKDQERRP
jgi:hypothetical protein